MFFIESTKKGKRVTVKGLHASCESKNIITDLKKGQLCILMGEFKGSITYGVQPHRLLNICIWGGSLFDVEVIASFETPTGSIGNYTKVSNQDLNNILSKLTLKEKNEIVNTYRHIASVIYKTRDNQIENGTLPTVKLMVELLDKQFKTLVKILEPYTDAFIEESRDIIIQNSENGKRNGSSERQSFYGEKAIRLYKTIMLLKMVSPFAFAVLSASASSIYDHTIPLPRDFLERKGMVEIKDAILAHHEEQGVNYGQIIKLSGSTDLTRVEEVYRLIVITHINVVNIHKNHPLGSLYTKHFKKGVITQTIRFVTGDTSESIGDVGVSETTITEQLQNACIVPIGISIEINTIIQSALKNRVPNKQEFDDIYNKLKAWDELHFTGKALPKIIGFHLHVITGIFGTPCHNDLNRDTVLRCLAFFYVHTKELNLPLGLYLPAEPENVNPKPVNTRCLFGSVKTFGEITNKQTLFTKEHTYRIKPHHLHQFKLLDEDLSLIDTKYFGIDIINQCGYIKERIVFAHMYATFFKSINEL